MNRKLIFTAAMLLAVMLPFVVMGQDKKDAAGTVSITGCFNKGADADHYVIKDGKTGKETVVTGDATMLSRHANNHEVTITGAAAKDNGKDVVKATELKMIAVCK
jgi:hypothetical protein